MYDLEVSPNFGAVWRLWKQNVPVNMIERDWFIMSYAAKWLGSDKVMYKDLRDLAPTDYETGDLVLLKHLHSLLGQADIVVAHNGKRFDNKMLNARFIINGLPPLHNYKVVDTLLVSRSQFGFPSHSLEYLSTRLLPEEFQKRKSAKYPGYALWKECLQGNLEAWQEMEDYNRQDVVALEALYLKLRPWVIGHPNVGNLTETEPDKETCPKCGSTDLHKRGTYHTQTQRYQRYRCNGCGGWSRGRFTQANKDKRKNILVN